MSFEDVMMKRLADCHAEACNEILASVRAGRSLSDAVSDAIEALPASKTRDLRRWIEDWEAWLEWQKWRAGGWRVQRSGRSVLLILPTAKYTEHSDEVAAGRRQWPSDAAVAAGAGVRAVKFRKMYERKKENGRWVEFMTVRHEKNSDGEVVTQYDVVS